MTIVAGILSVPKRPMLRSKQLKGPKNIQEEKSVACRTAPAEWHLWTAKAGRALYGSPGERGFGGSVFPVFTPANWIFFTVMNKISGKHTSSVEVKVVLSNYFHCRFRFWHRVQSQEGRCQIGRR